MRRDLFFSQKSQKLLLKIRTSLGLVILLGTKSTLYTSIGLLNPLNISKTANIELINLNQLKPNFISIPLSQITTSILITTTNNLLIGNLSTILSLPSQPNLTIKPTNSLQGAFTQPLRKSLLNQILLLSSQSTPNSLNLLRINTIIENLLQIILGLKIDVFGLTFKIDNFHYTKIKTNKFYKPWVEDHSDVIDISRERPILRVDTTDRAPMLNSGFTMEAPKRPTGPVSHTASISSPMSRSKSPPRLSRLAELPSISTSLPKCPKMTSTSESDPILGTYSELTKCCPVLERIDSRLV